MQKKRLWLSFVIAATACGAPAVASPGMIGTAGVVHFAALAAQAMPSATAGVVEPSAVNESTVFGENPSQAAERPRSPRPRTQQSRADRRPTAASERSRATAARPRNTAPGALATTAAVRPAPRLMLDPPEPQLSEEALAIERAIEVVAYAASAARQAASAASAAQSRINTLERTVGELRDETQSQRAQLAQGGPSRRWGFLLGAAVVLLAGLALWLARRLAHVQRDYEQRLLAINADASALPLPTGQSAFPRAMPFTAVEPRQLSAQTPPGPRLPQPPAWPAPAPAPSWVDSNLAAPATMPAPASARQFVHDAPVQPSGPMPPGLPSTADDVPASPRDVSIEELIDLEQQAEFFVVLGQDDAAIDLLSEHLRSTGGGSPLPYLKLLEIYRRRGERDDYERIRTRFNQRFSAYAPEWGSDLGAGKSLQDYNGILPRLQQVWARPFDAMAEMEALLFRKSRGDLFDLPAYRELLFLYSLARDLLDREAADSGTVDLLLPLSDGEESSGQFGPTAPAPYLRLDAETQKAQSGAEDRATLPLDFDLTIEGQRQTSIFDPQQEQGGSTRSR